MLLPLLPRPGLRRLVPLVPVTVQETRYRDGGGSRQRIAQLGLNPGVGVLPIGQRVGAGGPEDGSLILASVLKRWRNALA